MSGEPRDQDSQMAAQLKRGESTAIESLYDRYGRLAFGLAFRILNERGAAEDVVQDAFVSVWRNAAGFDARRGSLRNWLLSIVRNRAIDRLRGSARVRREIDLADAAQRAEVPDVWEAVALDLERKQIQEGFRDLPDPQRQTLEIGKVRSEEHTSELQSPCNLVCRLLLEKKKKETKRM